MKVMQFSEIKPFVRYARYMHVDKKSEYPLSVPCDARLFYTVDGVGEIRVNDEAFTMKKGDLLFFGAGTKYKIMPSSEGVSYIALNFDYTSEHSHLAHPIPPKTPDKMRERDIIEAVRFDDVCELSMPVRLEKKFDISNKLLEIKRDFSKKILYFETKASNILSEILIDCVRELKLQTVPDGYERINAIIKFIHENHKEKMTNSSLGKRFGFHPNYISRLIKNYTGMPLHRYLLHVKISRTIEMLDEGQLSVGEIAEKCGFCDIYYFSRLFKQYMGISPLEYRGKRA